MCSLTETNMYLMTFPISAAMLTIFLLTRVICREIVILSIVLPGSFVHISWLFCMYEFLGSAEFSRIISFVLVLNPVTIVFVFTSIVMIIKIVRRKTHKLKLSILYPISCAALLLAWSLYTSTWEFEPKKF